MRKKFDEIIVKIRSISSTSFSLAGLVLVKSLTALFLFILMIVKFEYYLQGILVALLFSFILFSIIVLIMDMDDPFEYSDNVQLVDEVNFSVLYELSDRINNKISNN